MDGIVLAINTSVGAYVSPQGTYGTYTQGNMPVIVIGSLQRHLAVCVYGDEIFVHRPTLGKGNAGAHVRAWYRREDSTIATDLP